MIEVDKKQIQSGYFLYLRKLLWVRMRIGIDWKRSLLMMVVLFGVMYGLRYVIEDQETLCMAQIVIFVVVLLVGNLAFRK